MNFPLTRAGFIRLGPEEPLSPVVLSVPHAGRDYPRALLDRALPPLSALETLEDRYADLLVARAIEDGAVAIIACHARAWIDLNRDPRELDPAMLSPPPPPDELLPSAKVRHGLGLIPRRLGGGAPILSGRIGLEEARARIRETHAPYHAALEQALEAARRRFGIAILLDCHSMPPLPGGAAQLVIGDLHGRSTAPRFARRAEAVVRAAGVPLAHNMPYAGAYILRRHGHPARGVHALQIEVDRSLYLDAELRTPSPRLPKIAGLIAAVAAALAEETGGFALPEAAE